MVRASPLPASGFPAAAKSQNPFFSGLKSGLVDLLPHITGARRAREKISLFSATKNCGRLQYAAFLQRHRCAEPLANYLLSPCTRLESWSCWTESFSAYTLTIYYTASGKAHLQLWRRPPHCKHLLRLSQDPWAADCSSALLRASVFTREN